MRIKQESLLDFIAAPSTRPVIPVYQRAYSWTRDQCLELWLDVQRAARSGSSHFTGTILYSVEPAEGNIERRSIIDGQQRLTTATVLLAALCQRLAEQRGSVDGLDSTDLAMRYLTWRPRDEKTLAGTARRNGAPTNAKRQNPTSLGADDSAPAVSASHANHARLLLSPTDAPTLDAIVASLPNMPAPSDAPGNTEAGTLPDAPSERLLDNLAFFREQMADPSFDANRLWRGLELLSVISAELDDPGQAQLVFESLNSKGRPLTVADLVRNYLLLAESRSEQRRLHQEYWQPIEGLFAPDPGSLRLDSAIKGWLSVRFRKTRMRSPELVYSGFKQYVEDAYDGTKEDLLRELRGFCLMWAENYRFHAVKKYRSAYAWAVNGAPTLTAGYALKKADDEAYAERVRAELRSVDMSY